MAKKTTKKFVKKTTSKKTAAKKTVAKKTLTKTEFRQKWINALKSGNYDQTTGVLQDAEGYCCLGVACAVYNKNFSNKLETLGLNKNGTFDPDYDCVQFDDSEGTLPEKVRNALGIASPDGEFELTVDQAKEIGLDEEALAWNGVDDGKVTMSLVALNDDHDFSFKQIAKVVEMKPKGLFGKAK